MCTPNFYFYLLIRKEGEFERHLVITQNAALFSFSIIQFLLVISSLLEIHKYARAFKQVFTRPVIISQTKNDSKNTLNGIQYYTMKKIFYNRSKK